MIKARLTNTLMAENLVKKPLLPNTTVLCFLFLSFPSEADYYNSGKRAKSASTEELNCVVFMTKDVL